MSQETKCEKIGYTCTVTNIIARCHLGIKVPIVRKNFSGQHIRLKHTTCAVFENGKVVSMGGKSIDQIKTDLLELCQRYKGSSINEFLVVNIVCHAKFETRVDFKKVIARLPQSFFAPEICPSIQIDGCGGTKFLLHHTGSCIITNIKTVSDIEPSCVYIANLLNSCI